MRRPRFIAAQARHATGPTGRLIAWIMARETRADNLRAIEALDLQPLDNVLDIGTGHGAALTKIASRVPGGVVTGLDPSQLMVEMALGRNASLVRSGRVRVVNADVADLPFAAEAFDKVMAVHALYFWSNLGASLEEIARVLKPGGCLALVFRSASDERAVAAFPPSIYHFPTMPELEALIQTAGMTVRSILTDVVNTQPGAVLVVASRGGQST